MENPPPPSLPQSPAPATTSGLAVTSMILGIVSLIGGFFLIIPPILAVVFGHVSLSQTKKNPALGGRGMGIAGLVMGYLAVIPCVVMVIGLFAAMSIPAFQKVRIASQEKVMMNNARQLANAADQFYLESGKTVASYADIVGPQKLVKRVTPIDHEQYPTVFEQGHDVVVVKKDGKIVKSNLSP